MIIITTTIFVQGAQIDIQWLSGPVKTGKSRDRGGGGAGTAIALPLFCWDLFSRALVDMEKITL